jgi:4-amino-4-deoxy-L-arabinose transferase-like glycosyltransferase
VVSAFFYEIAGMTRFAGIAAISLTVMVCCLAFAFQGSRGIWQPDEGYYVGASVTMLERQTLLIPFLGEDEIFLDKPPMIYWAIIAGMELFGHNEFAVRFFHGLAFALTSVVVGLLAWSMYRSTRVGIFSGIVYATMIVPFFAANFVTPDTLLTLWTTMAMLCFWESTGNDCRRPFWQMLLAVTVGFGFLAKGPAAFIPCGAMFAFLAVRRQLRRYFLTPWSLAAIAVFIIVGLGWYIHVSMALPGALDYFFDSQIWGRMFSQKFNRNPGPVGALIYIPVIIFGAMPWSLLWLGESGAFGRNLVSRRWWRSLRDRPVELLLACWFIVPLTILTLSSSRLGLYALPVFPMFAIGAAKIWDGKFPRGDHVGAREGMVLYKRHIVLCSVIAVALVMAKLGMAVMPSASDMRLLSSHLKGHLPPTPYELGTIDKRADGLLFYGVQELEHLTDESNPYPTFSRTEHVLAEMAGLDPNEGTMLLLVTGAGQTRELCETLKRGGIAFDTVELPYRRSLLTLHSTAGRHD